MVATSTEPEDDALVDVALSGGFRVYRGSLIDVLGRVVEAARTLAADVVLRVTGDCPLVDPDLIDAMVATFESADVDYLSNVSPPTFPDGLDVELIRMSALEAAAREAKRPHDREHVTTFIRQAPDAFRLANTSCAAGDLSRFHWSVDRREDLDVVADLLAATGKVSPRLVDLIAVTQSNPALAERSVVSPRNEGAVQSFLSDLERRHPRPIITRSDEIWARAAALIPAGTQTLSKGPTQFTMGFAPKFIVRGRGSHVWDPDGNEYIDYPMALGPVTLGYGHPAVTEAVTRQLEQGITFSLMHPLEVELAERIVKMVPCAERVRFGKNGSDATSACIRAARAKTGRKYVARCGYHGWQDWSIDRSYGVRAKGVPEEVMRLTVPFPYNDLPKLEGVLREHECAAVILEPVAAVAPEPGYLAGVRRLATQYGAVLVFDEVITGFRYARGGAQEYFGVTPDLTAMGKGVANGLPLSIVAGKCEFMQAFEDIFFSFTFGGETLALAAALATLDVMERHDYWAHVWRQGAKLQDAYRDLARQFRLERATDCGGMPPWTVLLFHDSDGFSSLQMKTLFQQEMLRQGILFSGSQFISLAHTDGDIERTIAAYREAMGVLRFALDCQSVDRLTLGGPIELVFRRS